MAGAGQVVQFPTAMVSACQRVVDARRVLQLTDPCDPEWREVSVDAEAAWQQLVQMTGTTGGAEDVLWRHRKRAS